MTRIMIIEEIFKLYDSGQLRGKIVKMTYNGATHLVGNFTDRGGIRRFCRDIFQKGAPPVRGNECKITDCLTDYLYGLLMSIRAKSFVDKNLFAL